MTSTNITDVNGNTVAPSGAWIDPDNGAYNVQGAVLRQSQCDWGRCTEVPVGVLVSGWECRPMCEKHGKWSEGHDGIRTGTFVLA